MTPFFRTCVWLVLPALLAAGPASAQVAPAQPLGSDPARAVFAPTAAQLQGQRRGVTALSLPFFDEFTTPLEGAPKVDNWEPGGGTLVNNRFAIRPLTRGTATFDGLRANGSSYSGQLASRYGDIDSLTSQPINLAGLSAADQVALSFAWQAGSVVGAPNRNASVPVQPVNLELYVKTDANVWESVWSYASVAQVTGFKQQVVLLNQGKYLHGTFQFRFVARGNRSGNSDTWNIDYVLLNRGRSAGLADTTFVDAAISGGLKGYNPTGGLRSPLRRFTAMPVWQFNAASAQSNELSPTLGVNLTNLERNLPRPIDVLGTVKDLTTNTVLGPWLQSQSPIPAQQRQYPQAGPASTQLIPTTPTAKRLRYTLALNSRDIPRALPNDTISRDVELSNYFAYDDGTAERYTALAPAASGQQSAYAYRFDLNQPDHVGGLRLYPVYTASDVSARPVTISVWANDGGHPAAAPIATKTATLPGTGPLPSGLPYVEITFDQPVPVSGIFYVGYSQPSTGRDLHYGLDINNSFPPGYLWNRSSVGVWDSVRFSPRRGALMMRPVMTNNVTTASASAREAAAYSLYPNPAHGSVRVAGPGFARATLLDALGRTVWEQPAGQAGESTLALPTLPAGVYTVRLTLADGRTVGRRLLLE